MASSGCSTPEFLEWSQGLFFWEFHLLIIFMRMFSRHILSAYTNLSSAYSPWTSQLLLCLLCHTYQPRCLLSSPEAIQSSIPSLSFLYTMQSPRLVDFLWSLSSVCVYFLTLMPLLSHHQIHFGFLQWSPNWSPTVIPLKCSVMFDSAL